MISPLLILLSLVFSTHAVVLKAGTLTTCAILSTNTAKCWGVGRFNGNGNSNDIGSSSPSMGSILLPIIFGSDSASYTPISIETGGDDSSTSSTCAILQNNLSSNKIVRCFGKNDHGKLGFDTSSTTWGDSANEMNSANFSFVDLGTNLQPSAISVGFQHVCAIVSRSSPTVVDRRVKCWGNGGTGALGTGSNSDYGTIPASMGDSLPFFNLTIPVLQVVARSGFTCVVASPNSLTNGDVYCTGLGTNGVLGQGSTTTIYSPLIVPLGTGKTVSKLSCGSYFCCALIFQDQSLKCWGDGYYNALGTPSQAPIGSSPGQMGDNLSVLSFGSTVSDFEAGSHHVCILLSTGSLKCMGANNFGQLGSLDTCQRPSSVVTFDCSATTLANLVTVSLGTSLSVTGIALGAAHSCVMVTGNFAGTRIKCWGRSLNGECGHEDTTQYGSAASPAMGDNLPYTNIGEPTSAPTHSPTSSQPSKSPSKGPTTSTPSKTPSTSNPSRSPTSSPSKVTNNPTTKSPFSSVPTQLPTTYAPTASPSRAPTAITKSPSKSPTASNPASVTAMNVGVGVGITVGILALGLGGFVFYTYYRNLSKEPKAAPTNWLNQVDLNAPRVPLARPVSVPNPTQQLSFESGNPVYAGIHQTAAANLSQAQIFEKLKVFYQRVDPNKSKDDINDLSRWAAVNGEEPLYAKLRKKYGVDPEISSPSSRFDIDSKI